jgi:hypothetical protein
VVSRHHVDGHRQRREQLADPLVLARARIVDQVAADQDGAWQRLQLEQGAHRPRKREGGVLVTATDVDVRIGELCECRQTFLTWS